MDYYTQIKNLIEKVGVKNIREQQMPSCTIYRIILKNAYYLYISLDEPCLWMGWSDFSIKYKGSIINCNDYDQKQQLKSYLKSMIGNHVKSILA